MPKQINTPTAGRRLVKLFNLKGRYQPVLDEVVVPVVDVSPETDMRPATANAAVSGAAGERGIAWIQNDPFLTSNRPKIVLIERVLMRSAVADNIYFLVGPTWTLGTQNDMTAAWRDTRLAGSPSATAEAGTSSFDNAAAAIARYQSPTTWENLTFPFLLAPGTTFAVQQQSPNVTFYVSFQWSEYDVVAEGYVAP